MHKQTYILLAALMLLPLGQSAPTSTPFNAKLHLSGDATHHGNSALVPDAQFQYDLSVSGTITQTSSTGLGSSLAGTLSGTINITYQDQNGNTVVVNSEPVTLQVNGERSSFIAQGVDGLQTTIEQTGQTGNLRVFTLPNVQSNGVSQNDDGSKTYAIIDHGSGQAQFQNTQHFALNVAGDLTLSPQ